MIILPLLLVELLDEVDEPIQWKLAIAYARHNVAMSGDPDAVTRFGDIFDRAETLLEAGKPPEACRDLLHDFYRRDSDSELYDTGTTIHNALQACFEREIQSTRHPELRTRLSKVNVVDVAKLAQKAVGRFETTPEAQRQARWEEARWQLIRLIEEVPQPERR